MDNLGPTEQTTSFDKLFAGDHPPVTIPVIIGNSGNVEVRGRVLGRVTATGKYGRYDDTATDGTEVARAILAKEVDATSADVNTVAYVHGVFNEAALTGIDTAGKLDLLDRGVIVKSIG